MIKIYRLNTLTLWFLNELDNLNNDLIHIYKIKLKNYPKSKMSMLKKSILISSNKKKEQTLIYQIIKNVLMRLMIGYINSNSNLKNLKKTQILIEKIFF